VQERPKSRPLVGETPNLAARLQALAEPGAVLIAAATRDLTGGLFDYRDLGTMVLKDFAENVPAWQVLGASAIEALVVGQYGRPRADLRFIAAILSIPCEECYGAVAMTPQKFKDETLLARWSIRPRPPPAGGRR
jgi:hypothetical protein